MDTPNAKLVSKIFYMAYIYKPVFVYFQALIFMLIFHIPHLGI